MIFFNTDRQTDRWTDTQTPYKTIHPTTLYHKQLVLNPQTLSTILPTTGQNKHNGDILLYETSLISIMVGHFDYKHRYIVEKNVPIALTYPVDGKMVLRVQEWSSLAVHAYTGMGRNIFSTPFFLPISKWSELASLLTPICLDKSSILTNLASRL